MDIKFQADTKMADSKRELELRKASFNQEVNTKVCILGFILFILPLMHYGGCG